MRWEILQKSWKMAKANFPDVESIFVAIPARFKSSGSIPVFDLSIHNKVGEISYQSSIMGGKTFVSVSCGPLSDTVAISAASVFGEFEIKTAEKTVLEKEEDMVFNHRQAKAKKFPARVHILMNGEALTGADVLQTQTHGRKGKEKTRLLVRPDGRTEPIWVWEDQVNPILAGHPMTANVYNASSLKKTAENGDVVSFTIDTYEPLEPVENIASLPDGSIVIVDKEGVKIGPYSKQRTELIGFLQAGGRYPQGEMWIAYTGSARQRPVPAFIGPMKVAAWEDINIGEIFYVRRPAEAGRTGASFDFVERTKLGPYHPGYPLYVYEKSVVSLFGEDPFKYMERITNLKVDKTQRKSKLEELKRKLVPQSAGKPGTKIILKNENVNTIGEFKGWKPWINPMTQTVSKELMLIQYENGTVAEIDPFSEKTPVNAFIARELTSEDLQEYLDAGNFLVICNDPVLEKIKNIKKTPDGQGWVAALVAIRDNIALIRVKSDQSVIHVPVGSLKPIQHGQSVPKHINDVVKYGHPFEQGDVIVRTDDNGEKAYVVEEDMTKGRRRTRDEIRVKSKNPQGETYYSLIPMDSKNRYVGFLHYKGKVIPRIPAAESEHIPKSVTTAPPPPARKKPAAPVPQAEGEEI